jgi:hypothetical protein
MIFSPENKKLPRKIYAFTFGDRLFDLARLRLFCLRAMDCETISPQRRTRNARQSNKRRRDFIPTKPFYLFGQHFSAIAAAGPIAGPIIACQAFGWLPCLLWIAFGVVLIGAVHDFST